MPAAPRRLAACVLSALLALTQGGVCAAWMPARDGRAPCCASMEGACPMHAPAGTRDSGGSHPMGGDTSGGDTDTTARCCAASRPESPTPPTAPSSVEAPSLDVAPIALVAPPRLARAYPIASSPPRAPAHRHLLFSVLLV